MLKILFVVGKLGYIDSIAVAYLSSVAKCLGHSTFFCSLDDNNFINEVKLLKPDVIAYSAFSYDMDAFEQANKLAHKFIDFISIIGGPHPTFDSDDVLNRGFDVCVVGEGECTFREFLQCVGDNKSFDNVHGLITKNQIDFNVRPLIQDIDSLPIPDRDLILSNTVLGDTSKKTFFTSRGCPYKCTYCLNPSLQKLYKGKGKYVRRHSVDRIIAEILEVREKYFMRFIKFDDDVFTLKADSWLEEFSIKYKKFINLPFNCLVHLGHINDDILNLLKTAGCHSVTTSVDSASNCVRKEILNRKITNEKIINSLQKIDSYNIETFVNFILDLPTSTIEDELESIKIGVEAKITYLGYTFLSLFPGTKMFEYCKRNKIIDDSYKVPFKMTDEPMLTFSSDERRIRKNIMDLGHIAMISPKSVRDGLMNVIINSDHIDSFSKLRIDVHRYNMEKIIYKCSDDVVF